MSSAPMQNSTPSLALCSVDLNQTLPNQKELAQNQRHFMDPVDGNIIYPVNVKPPPIPPRKATLKNLPLPPLRSTIPMKVIQSVPENPIQSNADECLAGNNIEDLREDANQFECDKSPLQQPESPKQSECPNDRLQEESLNQAICESSIQQRESINDTEDKNDEQKNSAGGVEILSHETASERSKPRRNREPSYTLSRFLKSHDNTSSSRFNELNSNNLPDIASINLTKSGCDPTKPDSQSKSQSKNDCVYPVLSRKFLELSKSPNTCATLRHSRCIPLLVQMIHCGTDDLTKQHACEALRNVVHFHPDDKAGRREAKILRYIEQIIEYCNLIRESATNMSLRNAASNHPLQAISNLMKISFDEDHRQIMCQLGALQTIATLVHYDHAVHGTVSADPMCISLRRYAGMALTNLTFGDGNNKALLCTNREFMKALVAQINTDVDDLLQVTANVLRNLSWRAVLNMKTVLSEIGTVTALTVAAMRNKNETTLKAILSALWNLSAHCSKNKRELCQVEGALLFLVEMLTYNAPSRTLSIVENAGGILRNVSSHIAVNANFRKILRQGNCLSILLKQLKSECLTIVSNACGTLWNLSARCPEDQKFLLENGAVPVLRKLIHSKHKMISDGSRVALRNLLNFRELHRVGLDPMAKMLSIKESPTLSPVIEGSSVQTVPTTVEPNSTTKLAEKEPAKVIEPEADQITNFSLLYSENDADSRDSKAKKTRTCPGEDTIKCYDSEGTPPIILSTANSLTDLQMIARTTNTQQRAKNGPTTAENSGINTPEQPIQYYYEDDGSAYHSRRDSLCSALCEDEGQGATAEYLQKPAKIPLTEMHKSNESTQCLAQMQPLIEDESNSVNHTVPSTPRQCTSRSAIFNEFDLETPMMFSRRSSLGSLGPHEAAFNDEIASVVSEFSRQPSGIISPSEIPDSPSQSMPHSPRQKRGSAPTFPRIQHMTIGAPAQLPYDDDEVKTFEVENTPVHISCATSISNLSFDDEPKVTNGAMLKEMRSTLEMSEEECNAMPVQANDAPIALPRRTESQRNNAAGNSSVPQERNIVEKSIELEDSSDGEIDDQLLENCINAGIQATARAPSAVSDVRSHPPLPHQQNLNDDVISSDDDANDNDDALLQQCIQSGMRNTTINAGSTSIPSILPSAKPSNAHDNPFGMFRNGGRSYLDVDREVTSRFHTEGSPRTFSVISGLSDLTIGSQKVGLIKENRPATATKYSMEVPTGNKINNNPPTLAANKPSPSPRVHPFGMFRNGGPSHFGVNCDDTNRFNTEDSPRTFSIISGISDLTIGSQKIGLLKENLSSASKQQGNNSTGVVKANKVDAIYDSNESISSNDDECSANDLLQQCIQDGIRGTSTHIAPKLTNTNGKMMPVNPAMMQHRVELATPSSYANKNNSNEFNTHTRVIYGSNGDGESKQSQQKNTKCARGAPEEDTIRYFVSEGTPPMRLSPAASLNNIQHLPKNGHAVVGSSSNISPERPVRYDQGGGSLYPRRESTNSAQTGRKEQKATISYAQKPPNLVLVEMHKSNDSAQCTEQAQQHSENGSNSVSCTVPSTPGECSSKAVTFNEFDLETPMMFSRRSSLGSLGPHEAAFNDDIASVVSEFSRQPSGIVSPSEIPDSPSQSMPQSPHHKRRTVLSYPRIRPMGSSIQQPYDDDEVKTFYVENTPAHISCATSISNLSFDDEPKYIDELPAANIQPPVRPRSSDVQTSIPEGRSTVPRDEKTAERAIDSDDSSEDDEIVGKLLQNCINAGIKATTRPKIVGAEMKTLPTLPKPEASIKDDVLSSDDDANENDDAILQQCIQSGMKNTKLNSLPSNNSTILTTNKPSPSVRNPFGLFRNGGGSYVGVDCEVTSRFHTEDSPRTFSVISGLSDLTINSQKVGLLKENRVPAMGHLANNSMAMPKVNKMNANIYNSNESISSIDDESTANELLQQCIQAGIRNSKAHTAPKSSNSNNKIIQPRPVAMPRRLPLPTPRTHTLSRSRSRPKSPNDHSTGNDKRH